MRPDELIPQLDVRRDPAPRRRRRRGVADPRRAVQEGGDRQLSGGRDRRPGVRRPRAPRLAGDRSSAIVAYAVQIYCDFSGYTDIAIGIAKLLGFQFPQNFDRPYSARSVQEFWRRWHMTLSRWLRDYLYIPLGGNRKGTVRTYVNLMITMLLGGLWHGAAWTSSSGAACTACYLAVGHWKGSQARRGALAEPPDTALGHAMQWPATFTLVCIAWVFFRADSVATALSLLARP